MRIATWNVNGLRARMDFIAHWLKSREPDVVGLQELKTSDEEFPYDDFLALGYHAVVHGQKGWNGVAVLSRTPAEAETRGLPGREDDGARLLRVGVAGLHFATVYCPNGKTLDHPDFPLKLAWFDGLRDYLAGVDRDAAFVIGGDFNIVPAALDCWQGDDAEGSLFCTVEERSRYRALLDLGLTDLFRHLYPEEQKFSWWDYRGGAFHRGFGLRIDHLLGTPAVASRVRRVEIDREYRKKKDGNTASDHAPGVRGSGLTARWASGRAPVSEDQRSCPGWGRSGAPTSVDAPGLLRPLWPRGYGRARVTTVLVATTVTYCLPSTW